MLRQAKKKAVAKKAGQEGCGQEGSKKAIEAAEASKAAEAAKKADSKAKKVLRGFASSDIHLGESIGDTLMTQPRRE